VTAAGSAGSLCRRPRRRRGADIRGLQRARAPAHLVKGDYQIRVAHQDPCSRTSFFLALDLINQGVAIPEATYRPCRTALRLRAHTPRSGLHPLILRHQHGLVPGSIACGWLARQSACGRRAARRVAGSGLAGLRGWAGRARGQRRTGTCGAGQAVVGRYNPSG